MSRGEPDVLRWGKPRRAALDVRVPAAGTDPVQLGYLAGIMDGEGYFCASGRTNAFGMRVAMTDKSVVDHLQRMFAGSVSRAGVTSAGNRVYTWMLSRQADLAFLLPLLIPVLVCKRAQAAAMLAYVQHQMAYPSWDTPTSRVGHIERERRRVERDEWQRRGDELRAAIRLVRREG